MSTINVTKRTGSIPFGTNTYVLNTAIPDSDRRVTLDVQLTRVAAFDGAITVKARARGSSAAYQGIAYTLLGTGATTAAALGAADAIIRIDATGLEVALDCVGGTVGSMTYDITDSPEA